MSLRRSGVILALGALLIGGACRHAESRYVPRDPVLRALPLYFYPAAARPDARHPMVFFFGNDVGFWEAHQRLAERLAGDGYSVVGFDARDLLKALPDNPEAARRDAYATRIAAIIGRARHELGDDSLPIIIGGHSIGAELAIWTAARVPVPHLEGVLALSPGSRGHLGVSISDVMNAGEPHGLDSFAVADQVSALASGVRLAIVRGQHDEYRYADSALVASGRGRAKRYWVPFAGHSLKSLVFSGPVVELAMRYVAGR